jgi:NAD(P)-dependent dehydrogenase (short-subunit alcohol dehydrogenase family)
VALAARDVEKLERVARTHPATGRESIAIVRRDDRAAGHTSRDEAIAAFGWLDVVVANAGAYQRKPATELTRADFDAAFASTSSASCISSKPYCRDC